MGQFGKQSANEASKITVRTETLDTEPSAVAPGSTCDTQPFNARAAEEKAGIVGRRIRNREQ
jgi:hypothetical protein